MKRSLFLVLIVLTLLLGAAARAQDASSYELTGFVVASGSSINGGDYTMNGVLGQPDTGTLSGSDYALGGGFFGGGAGSTGASGRVFLPLVRR